MIVYHNDEYFKRVPIEKQRVCCNCKNRQVEPSRCKVHGIFLHYETIFEGWCKRWKGGTENENRRID